MTGFGLFVTLDESRVDGLVHVTALDSDYYRFDPIHHRMVGERSGRTYRLGDPIAVQVARVDLDERKIDFVPEGAPEPGRRKGLNTPRTLPQEEQDSGDKERKPDRGAGQKAGAKKKRGSKRPSVKTSKRSSAAASREKSSAIKAAPKKAASKKKAGKKRS